MYEIYPVIDEMKCDKTKLGNSLMTHTQAAAITGRQQQVDDDDKPQLGFVSVTWLYSLLLLFFCYIKA